MMFGGLGLAVSCARALVVQNNQLISLDNKLQILCIRLTECMTMMGLKREELRLSSCDNKRASETASSLKYFQFSSLSLLLHLQYRAHHNVIAWIIMSFTRAIDRTAGFNLIERNDLSFTNLTLGDEEYSFVEDGLCWFDWWRLGATRTPYS